jgi:hypothetical protein
VVMAIELFKPAFFETMERASPDPNLLIRCLAGLVVFGPIAWVCWRGLKALFSPTE